MAKNPWEYFVLVRKVWWTEKIPGPGFAILGIAAAVAAPLIPSTKAALSTGIAAGLFLLVSAWSVLAAQYRVWRAEREAYQVQCAEMAARRAEIEAEKARNEKPEIRGRVIAVCSTGITDNSLYFDSVDCSTGIPLQIHATNFRQVTTSVTGIRIDGSALRIPATFENAEVWRPQLPGNPAPHSNRPEMVYAIHADLSASAEVTIEGHQWKDIGRTLDLTGLKVELIDAFGGAHSIDVEPGTSISV